MMMKKLLSVSFALMLGVVALSSPVLAGPGENNSTTPDGTVVVYGPGENN
jgi:hypothetical protein